MKLHFVLDQNYNTSMLYSLHNHTQSVIQLFRYYMSKIKHTTTNSV